MKNIVFKLSLLILPLLLTGCDISHSDGGESQHHYSDKWSYDENNHWHACTDKGHEDLKKDVEKHDFEVTNTPATYESNGYDTYKCKICDYSYKVDTETPLEHIYEDGYHYDSSYHWRQCIDKGYENLFIDKQRHDLTTIVDTPATYEQEGLQKIKCLTCEYEKSEAIPKLVHKYEQGYHFDKSGHWHVCTDEGYEGLISGFEKHAFASKVVASTFEKQGYTRYTCSVCGYYYDDDFTDVLPHNYSDYIIFDDHHEKQCIDEGYEDLVISESHTFIEHVIPATYEETGSKYLECSVCGYISYPEDSEIPALEHHYSTEWERDKGHHWHPCIDEGYEDLYSDYDYHTDLIKVIDVKPTSSTPGKGHYVCGVCGEDYYAYYNDEYHLEEFEVKSYDDRFTYYLNKDETSYRAYFEGIDYFEPVTDLYLPNEFNGLPVTEVENYFSGGRYYQKIHVPKNVSKLTNFFRNYAADFTMPTNYIQEWIVDENNSSFSALDGVLYSKDKTTLLNYPEGKKGDKFTSLDSVKEIGQYAFTGTLLEEVSLSNGIEHINSYAFTKNHNLTKVTIGNTIKQIDYVGITNVKDDFKIVFTGVNDEFVEFNMWNTSHLISLENTTKKDGIYYLASSTNPYYLALQADKSIVKADIDSNCKAICTCCFMDCPLLEEANIPDGVTYLNYPFRNDPKLKKLTIGEGVSSIYAVVSNCPNLTDLYYNAIDCAFNNNQRPFYGSNFEKIIFGDNVRRLTGDYIFAETLSNIELIELNEGLLDIPNACFENIDIDEIVLPSTLTNLRPAAFRNSSIGKLIYKCKNVDFSVIGDQWSGNENKQFYNAVIGELVIEDKVNNIANFASQLKEVIDKVTYKVNDYHINSNERILTNELVISNSVTRIPELFAGSPFAHLDIPASVSTIAQGAFFGCENLKDIVIPSSVTTFEGVSFDKDYLHSIYFEDLSSVEPLGIYLLNDGATTVYVNNNEMDTSSYISQVTPVYFSLDKNFKHVHIDNTEYLLLEENDNKIAILTRHYDIKNKDIDFVIPDSISLNNEDYIVTKIADYAFYSDSLNNLTISENITDIGRLAFNNCFSLTKVNWNAINVKDNLSPFSDSSIGFNNSRHLKEINFGDKVEVIPYGFFNNLKELNYLEIPENIQNIHNHAFYRCYSLVQVTIKASSLILGQEAFIYCNNLKEVVDLDNNDSLDYKYIAGNPSFTVVIDSPEKSKITLMNNYYLVYEEDDVITLLTTTNSIDRKYFAIPEGVTNISYYAFHTNKDIRGIYFPYSMTTIEGQRLMYLDRLAVVAIKMETTAFANNAFQFDNNHVLTQVIYEGDEDSWNAIEKGSGNSGITIAYEFVYESKIDGIIYDDIFTIIINEEIQTLIDFDNALVENSSLYIPEGVNYIDCDNYTGDSFGYYKYIYLPESLIEINSDTFTYLDDTNTRVDLFHFTYYIVIPNTLDSIDPSAFDSFNYNCVIYFAGNQEEWNSLTDGFSDCELTVYFYSETRPTTSGNYWHYNSDGSISNW